jgi:ribonuclease E
MLIDAAHAEETRVVVVDGTRVEEFDFESQSRKQLRGNIYLAKVTRVEPSLQAAFIEYGGNRHGFLAFNEIHPDYYQIPSADREALMHEAEEEDEEDRKAPRGRSRAKAADEDSEDGEEAHDEAETVSDDDDDDMEEEVARRRRRLMRKYKIQEVIKRRQIMLIQVVKEERGNKGAALTTYLSLAGRYCVLMPNTGRGGGISRKITTATDRKRLKGVVQALDVPQGMGLIVRTAGAKRTKAEIGRDYDYLLRMWENIRDTTLHSIAPALIYEEEDLVKRAIRDLYDKDIDGVWVEGAAGFKEARDFMRMIMPSQAKKIQHYTDPTPLFVASGVEEHLSKIYLPTVPLKSGGYLVINQTEALVAIDVNSGRSTKERNIEATALKTNMEAAEEACRQLRLRDLAGLIVIDFIDMDESKNNRAVEKKLKDCLAEDRARVQMGKISSFGLMEISRQRRRSGVLEGTTHVCEHCQGVGRVRSTESSALSALRGVEMEALRGSGEVTLKVSAAVGFYILNEKRDYLTRVHQAHGVYVTVQVDESLSYADHEIERTITGEPIHHAPVGLLAPSNDTEPEDDFIDDVEEDEAYDADELEDEEEREDTEGGAPHREAGERERAPRADDDADGNHRGRGRRRRRGRGRDDARDGGREPRDGVREARPEGEEAAAAPAALDDDADGRGRRGRRGRRGGRRMRDDARPQDGFTWTRPRVPFGDDPFVWHDVASLEGPQPRPANDGPPAALAAPADGFEATAEAAPARSGRERGRGRGRGRDRDRDRTESPVNETPVTEEAIASAPDTNPAEDIWVELPAPPEPGAPKARRSRGGRGRTAEAPAEETIAAEAVTEAASEPVTSEPEVAEPVAAAAPAKRSRSRKAAAPVVEAAAESASQPEPVAEPVAPEPAPTAKPAPKPKAVKAVPEAPAEPDPAEITAPPAAPKRGWWRRG